MNTRLTFTLFAFLTLLPQSSIFAQEAAKDSVPTYIARDVEPVLENTVEISELLARLYPDAMRRTGHDATVILWLFVEKDGTVGICKVCDASEFTAYNEVATKVAESMVFTPASWKGEAVAVWINQAILFKSGDVEIREM